MFLRNVWYIAGFSTDLPAGGRLGRRFLGEGVVLFRTRSGAIGALRGSLLSPRDAVERRSRGW